MSFKKIFRNSTFLIGGSVLNTLLGFFIAVILGRALGAERYGSYAFILAFVNLFTVVLDLGLNTVTVREISRNQKEVANIAGNVLSLKILLSIFCFFLVTGLTFFVDFLIPHRPEIIIGIIYLILLAQGSFFTSLFNGLERMEYTAFLSSLLKLLLFLFVGMMFLFHLVDVRSTMIVHLVSAALTFLVAFFFFQRNFQKILPRFSLFYWSTLIKTGVPFAVSGMLLVLCTKIDMTMLKAIQGDTASGLYDAALKISSVFLFIPANITFALYPAFSRYYISDNKMLNEYFVNAFKIIILFALPFAIVLTVLAKPIILFVWSSEFSLSSGPLVVLGWAIAVQFLSSLFSILLSATDKQKTILVVTFCALALNTGLNFLFIPRYSGTGAAITTLITNIFFLIAFLILSRPVIKFGLKTFFYLKFLFANALLLSFLVIAPKMHVVFLGSLSLFFYLLILHLLRLFRIHDVFILVTKK